MDAKDKSLQELEAEYITLNQKIMNDPQQSKQERVLATMKINRYLKKIKELYKCF